LSLVIQTSIGLLTFSGDPFANIGLGFSTAAPAIPAVDSFRKSLRLRSLVMTFSFFQMWMSEADNSFHDDAHYRTGLSIG